MSKTKVAICIPSRAAPRSIWFKHFCKWIDYMNKRDRYDYKLFIQADPTNNIGVIRERILNQVMADGTCDYMFWLDDDVLQPMDCIDQFLESGKDIATGIYWCRRNKEPFPLLGKYPRDYSLDEKINYEYYNHEEDPIFRVSACGFGCFWMKVEKVYSLTKPRFIMTNGNGYGEDVFFCRLLECADEYYSGFGLYAIGTCVCRHILWKDGKAKLLPDDKTWGMVNAKYR